MRRASFPAPQTSLCRVNPVGSSRLCVPRLSLGSSLCSACQRRSNAGVVDLYAENIESSVSRPTLTNLGSRSAPIDSKFWPASSVAGVTPWSRSRRFWPRRPSLGCRFPYVAGRHGTSASLTSDGEPRTWPSPEQAKAAVAFRCSHSESPIGHCMTDSCGFCHLIEGWVADNC